MLWLIFVCAVVLLCIVFLLYAPIEIRVRFEHIAADDNGFIELRYLYGLVRMHRKLTQLNAGVTEGGPTIGVQAETGKQTKSHHMISAQDFWGAVKHLHSFAGFVRQVLRILSDLAKHVQVRDMQFEADVGLSDAVVTCTSVGLIYALVETALGMAAQRLHYQTVPRVVVRPVINQTLFHVRTHSIMSIRMGYAIKAGIRLLLAWKRRT